jgi:DNA adenine methylase
MQPTLFDLENIKPPLVNTATVSHRSLFRYPGGKTWLVPYLRQWLTGLTRQSANASPTYPCCLVEPFVGGGIISLTAVVEEFVDHVVMVEKDEDVAAVWQTVLDPEDWKWLVNEIMSFDVTYENVVTFLAKTNLTRKERAFRTILRNRMNRGGILASGAGLLKRGENGKGLKSRWYPKTLRNRIQDIASIQERISFIQGDGIEVLKAYSDHTDAVFFIDPPYTAAGKRAGQRLYTHFELDHEELFHTVSKMHGDFLMTYDDTNEIEGMAKSFHFDIARIPMKNTHHTKMFELLIGPDLEWLRHLFT